MILATVEICLNSFHIVQNFTLMLKANSCSGVRNISGVKCSSNRSNRAVEHRVKQIPGRTRPARPFPMITFRINI